jgi:hypothetical protein
VQIRQYLDKTSSESSYKGLLNLLYDLTETNSRREVLDALMLTLSDVRVDLARFRKTVLLDFIAENKVEKDLFLSSWQANIRVPCSPENSQLQERLLVHRLPAGAQPLCADEVAGLAAAE